MKKYKVRDFMLIRLFFTVICNICALSSAVSAESHLQVEISRQSGISAAATITQNFQLIQEIAEGEVDPRTVASTIISDTDAALKVYEQYLRYKSNVITNQISSLKLHISSTNAIFSRTPNSQVDEALEALLNAVDDLEAENLALTNNANAASGLARTMNLVRYAGNTLSVIDTGFKANTLLNAIQDDADSLTTGIAAAELTNSTALTSFALAGSKYTPLIGLVYSGTEVTKWYTDTLGDAVRQEADSRTEAIAQEINNAGERVQSRIIALYQSGATPSDEEIRALAREEYVPVLEFITGFYDDVGFLESFFGIYESSTDYINQKFDLALFVLNNRIEDRAIRFSGEISDRRDNVEAILNQISISEQILEDSRLGAEFINVAVEPAGVNGFTPQVEVEDDNSGETSGDNTRDNELVVTENDEGDPVLGNNAGTNIEIPTEPTGPTP